MYRKKQFSLVFRLKNRGNKFFLVVGRRGDGTKDASDGITGDGGRKCERHRREMRKTGEDRLRETGSVRTHKIIMPL